jgi:hypothetical protein
MHNKLLIKAFDKAKIEIGSDRITHLSNHLSDFIREDSNEPYGERILRDNYNRIHKNAEDKIYLKAYAAEALSHYLGYKNYIDFADANSEDIEEKNTKHPAFFKDQKLKIIIVLMILSGIFIYNYSTRQRWMVWKEVQYVEVDFDFKKYNVNQLKVYKPERIDYFKKIKPTCDYAFFNIEGNVRIWYGKNKDGALEYFTALGLHPETGKTLKPITPYIIDKYICN